MSSTGKTLINKIYSWSFVKGSGDEGIDESIFLSGIIFVAKTGEDSDGDETAIFEGRVILGEKDSEITIIHREEEALLDDDAEFLIDLFDKIYDAKNFEKYLPKGLAIEVLQVAIHEDHGYLNDEDLLANYVYEEADSSYFSEIDNAGTMNDDETIMVGSFARYVELDESEEIDINDQDTVNKLSNKLCKSVYALGNCKKDVDGFDSDGFQWTGVHLVPLPDEYDGPY